MSSRIKKNDTCVTDNKNQIECYKSFMFLLQSQNLGRHTHFKCKVCVCLHYFIDMRFMCNYSHITSKKYKSITEHILTLMFENCYDCVKILLMMKNVYLFNLYCHYSSNY